MKSRTAHNISVLGVTDFRFLESVLRARIRCTMRSIDSSGFMGFQECNLVPIDFSYLLSNRSIGNRISDGEFKPCAASGHGVWAAGH